MKPGYICSNGNPDQYLLTSVALSLINLIGRGRYLQVHKIVVIDNQS